VPYRTQLAKNNSEGRGNPFPPFQSTGTFGTGSRIRIYTTSYGVRPPVRQRRPQPSVRVVSAPIQDMYIDINGPIIDKA